MLYTWRGHLNVKWRRKLDVYLFVRSRGAGICGHESVLFSRRIIEMPRV